MLEKLTKEQEDLIPIIRDKWLDQFFNLEFNEKKAHKLINFVYEDIMKWKKPLIIILDSPLGCQVAVNILSKISDWTGIMTGVWAEVRAKVSDQVWAEVSDQVRAKVSDKVGAKVRDEVREKVSGKVRAKVWDEVWAEVSDQVWAEVSDQVWAKVSDQVRAKVSDKVGAKVRDEALQKVNKLEYHEISWRLSSHDFYWVAYYDYFTEIGIINHKLFNKFRNLIRANIFSLILFKEIVFISKPPIKIHRNEKDDMHSVEGYAIEFADGFGLHYINGRHFTNQEFYDYIKREPSAKEIMRIDNQELRAEVIKHWGYDKIVSELQLKELDTYEDSILYSCKEFPINFVRVIDATSKKPYYLGVPRDQTDCLEAIAWTFGLTVDEYKERVES